MLKLTYSVGNRVCFINPKLVTDIMERTVYDQALDEMRGNTRVRGHRVEGCIIGFGGPEDSSVAVLEAAADVAAMIEEADMTRADRNRKAAGCTGRPDCQCMICFEEEIPF